MKKILFLTLIIITFFPCLAQKKRWTLSNGTSVKKSLATSYYTRTKLKDSNYILIKKYYLDHKNPFEEIGFQSKKILVRQGPYLSYYSNGSIKTTGKYINNQKDGLWESFDRNSKLNSISNFSNGKLHGAYTNYLKNGKIETGTYKNGKKNLLWSYTNYPNQLVKTILYSNGLKEGKTTLYYSNGNLKETNLYKSDLLLQTKYFDTEGNQLKEEDIQDDVVYTIVEDQPEFPGGMAKMMKYLARKTQYPQLALEMNIQGKVYVSFIVEKDGAISNVYIIRGSHKSLDKEAIRVVKNMPKWKPGFQKGKKVKVKYTIPINFRLR